MKEMKKYMAIVLAATAVLALCACGKQEPQTESAQTEMTSSLPGQNLSAGEDSSKAEAEKTEESTPNAADKAAAKALIGEEVSKLYEAIGQPNDSAYTSSCLGSGDDGELYYDGFTVYTYREGSSEKIQDVD